MSSFPFYFSEALSLALVALIIHTFFYWRRTAILCTVGLPRWVSGSGKYSSNNFLPVAAKADG